MFLNMVKVLLASVFVKLAKMPKWVLNENKNITWENVSMRGMGGGRMERKICDWAECDEIGALS